MSVAPFESCEDPVVLPAEPPAELVVAESAVPSIERGVGQVYVLLATCVLLAVLVGGTIQLTAPYLGLTISQIFFFLAPAVWFVRRKNVPLAEALRLRPISPRIALLSALLGSSGYGIAVGLAILTEQLIGPLPGLDFFQYATLSELALTLVCGAILPGICEEILFRGAVQGTLERLGAVKAIAITSVLFALFHLNPWNFLPPLFYGVQFGILARRSNSIVPTIIAHAATNATVFTLAYIFVDGHNEPVARVIVAVLAVVYVVAFSTYLMATRRNEIEPSLLVHVPAGLPSWAVITAVVLFAGVAAFIGALVIFVAIL